MSVVAPREGRILFDVKDRMEISVLTLGNRSSYARIIRGSRRVVAGRPGRLGADLTTDALTSSLLNIIYVVLYRAVVPTRLATKRPWGACTGWLIRISPG